VSEAGIRTILLSAIYSAILILFVVYTPAWLACIVVTGCVLFAVIDLAAKDYRCDSLCEEKTELISDRREVAMNLVVAENQIELLLEKYVTEKATLKGSRVMLNAAISDASIAKSKCGILSAQTRRAVEDIMGKGYKNKTGKLEHCKAMKTLLSLSQKNSDGGEAQAGVTAT